MTRWDQCEILQLSYKPLKSSFYYKNADNTSTVAVSKSSYNFVKKKKKERKPDTGKVAI